MIVFLLVMFWIALYGAGAGLTYTYALNSAVRKCKDRYCRHDHPFAAFWFGLGWPVGLPAMIATNAAASMGTGIDKNDKRRAREIEEAEHQTELARIRLEEDRLLNLQLNVRK